MTDPLPRRIAWFAPWTWKRRWWVLVAVVLLMGYPLSMGPAWGLMAAGMISPETVFAWYRPIVWLTKQRPEAYRIFEWYVSLFVW